jgi:hypothetical protein
MPWRRIGERTYSSTILELVTKWRWVVSFTPRLLYPRGKSPRYPLVRQLGGPQNRYGRCGEQKRLALAGNRTSTGQPVARHYTDSCVVWKVLVGQWSQGDFDGRPRYVAWLGGGQEKIVIELCLGHIFGNVELEDQEEHGMATWGRIWETWILTAAGRWHPIRIMSNNGETCCYQR